MGSDNYSGGAGKLLAPQQMWSAQHVDPVRDRIRAVGLTHAAPASLALVLVSLAATAAVRLPNPLQHATSALFVYHGRDLHTVTAPYRLPLSALLAQSWPQWFWTAFVAVVLFAPLESRVGPARLLGVVFAGQVLSTAVADVQAAHAGHIAQLRAADFGTSCLVVSAAAGYAWLTRSRLLAAVLGIGLGVDAILSAPLTVTEHWIAAVTGALVVSLRAPVARASAGPTTALVRVFVTRANESMADVFVATRTAWDVSHLQRIHCEVR